MEIILILFSYLLGSVSSAIIIGRIKGINIKEEGTCNAGATNVYSVIGPGWGILSGVFDFAKGVIPTYIAKELLNCNFIVVMIVGLSVIAGHNWPLFFGFNGGRGLATSLGSLGVIDFNLTFVSFILGGVISWLYKSVSRRKIRIPYLVYPVYIILAYFYRTQKLLLIYGFLVLVLAHYRSIQIQN